MGYWAIILNDTVDCIAIADSPLETGELWVNVDDITPRPEVSWKYKDGVFTSPPPPPPKADSWVITKVSMISRFTNAEYVGILTAKKTDVTVEAWYDAFQAANNVNLKDQNCIDGINFLVSKNLLTQERANEILTTPAQQNEIPA